MKVIATLSGGMDSATALAWAIDVWGKKEVVALTFDYGQRHIKEINSAKKLAEYFGVRHILHKIDLTQIGGSALTDKTIDVPEFPQDELAMKRSRVALTYVPARNTIFTALAVAYAEVLGAHYIYTGWNYIDAGGYPDTTPEYLEALNKLIALGTRDRLQIIAPLIKMTKKEIVEAGEELHVPWELTWSCYKGLAHPCKKCNACVQREKGFREAGVKDPLR